jgi:hypothetical protein
MEKREEDRSILDSCSVAPLCPWDPRGTRTNICRPLRFRQSVACSRLSSQICLLRFGKVHQRRTNRLETIDGVP